MTAERERSSWSWRPLCLLCLLTLFQGLCVAAGLGPCPEPSAGLASSSTGASVNVRFVSPADAVWTTAELVWVDGRGNERITSDLEPGTEIASGTFVGHAFRLYAEMPRIGRKLLQEHVVREGERKVSVSRGCTVAGVDLEGETARLRSERISEIESLVHEQGAACSPDVGSGGWSCVRNISAAEYAVRTPRELYGFATSEEAGHRGVGATVDRGYVRHIPSIPRLTRGPGYLKMAWTPKMREIIFDWFAANQADVKPHETIAGGYTNSHVVRMSKLDLDNHRGKRRALVAEMRDVLEWWTGRELKHTSTFGVRIYHKESMLINHVDRADTHLASAVLQVAQDGVEQGWPLEIIDADGNCAEVYLQPGEMVLYEGARFRHGRPMRFQGQSFANIFSHFAPKDWYGPGKSPKYDGRLNEEGFLLRRSDDDVGQRDEL